MIELNPYWVTFVGRDPACVEARSEPEAGGLARVITGMAVTLVRRLPYPAEPRIAKVRMATPSLCWQPEKCAGHTACPRDYACSE